MTVIKKRNLGRMVALAAVLCLITTCMLGGTLAKYTTTVNGTGTATVANWQFQANNSGVAKTFDVSLIDTTLNGKVADGKIAPGTDGSFNITIDASGSETAVNYTIDFGSITNKPTNLKFYSSGNFVDANEISNLETYDGLDGNIALDAVGTVLTKTVYWKWDYGTGVDDSSDQGKAMSFTITVTGNQVEPTVTQQEG